MYAFPRVNNYAVHPSHWDVHCNMKASAIMPAVTVHHEHCWYSWQCTSPAAEGVPHVNDALQQPRPLA
jgi:hypothetical protein